MRRILLVLMLLAAFAGIALFTPVKDFISGVAPIAKPAPPPPPSGERAPFTLPDGFAAYVFAEGLRGARVMIRDPKGAILLSQTSEGKVTALPNLDSDGKADRAITVLSGLNDPHGLLMLCPDTGFVSADNDACMLYVAESNRVARYRYDADTYTATLDKTMLTLPDDGGHYTRTLMLHPDNKRILVSVGSSCNVCVEENEKRAAILAVDPDSGEFSIYASGLRNTVFMSVHYVTGEVWGTDMGRDLLGDDIPPDELNIIREGGNYGWPICFGKNIHDAEFDKNTYIRNPCMEPFETPSHIDIQAHSAPLGLAFVPEEGWPEEWWYDALVAYHGSWNRSVPTGYKLVRFPLNARGSPEGEPEDFMTGFMTGGTLLGRPVDIMIEPGGTFYLSDDRAGAIYRIVRASP